MCIPPRTQLRQYGWGLPLAEGIIRRTLGRAGGQSPPAQKGVGRPSPASHHQLHLGYADGLTTKALYMM